MEILKIKTERVVVTGNYFEIMSWLLDAIIRNSDESNQNKMLDNYFRAYDQNKRLKNVIEKANDFTNKNSKILISVEYNDNESITVVYC